MSQTSKKLTLMDQVPRGHEEALNDAKMEHRAIRALGATWQAIGYDILQCTADESGKNINSVTIPRAEVMEVVMDADYAKMHGNDKEAVAWLNKQPEVEQKRILRLAFPHSRYGT